VFDLIGEILKSTERNALFWWILNIGVADGDMGDDDLSMALGSKGS